MHQSMPAMPRKITLTVLALSTVVLTSAGSCGRTDDPGGTQAPTTAQQQPGPTGGDERGNSGNERTPGGDTGSDDQGG